MEPTIEQLLRIRGAHSPAQLADGCVLYLDSEPGIDQLTCWSGPGRRRERLTSGTDGVDFFAASPDGHYVVVGASRGGDEQSSLTVLDRVSGSSAPLPGMAGAKCDSVVWADDGRTFAFRANERSGADFDLYVADARERVARRVAAPGGYCLPLDFAPGGASLLYARFVTNVVSQLWSLDLDTLEARRLDAGSERELLVAASYTSDGEQLVTVSDIGSDVTQVFVESLDRSERVALTDDRWPVDAFTIAPDRQRLLVGRNEDGYSQLLLFDLRVSHEPRELALPGRGVATLGSLRNGSAVFAFESPSQTGEIYLLDLHSDALRKLTHANYEGVDPSTFVEPELVHYPSFDGREIPALLYLPAGQRPEQPLPVLIHVHGGPEGQTRPRFFRYFQYLLRRGIAVLAPNVRGSSGYGRRWLALDDYTKRLDSVRDLCAGAEWLATQGIGDPDRIAVKGGSYGGYMTMAAVTERPDLWAAGVNVVGIVNFETFLEHTKAYRRKLRESEYGPLTDRKFLRSISPIHKVDRIRAPMFVAHGKNDPRVPVGEAEQVIEALEQRGLPVTSMIFADEGHGVRKLGNRIQLYGRIVRFLERHLGTAA